MESHPWPTFDIPPLGKWHHMFASFKFHGLYLKLGWLSYMYICIKEICMYVLKQLFNWKNVIKNFIYFFRNWVLFQSLFFPSLLDKAPKIRFDYFLNIVFICDAVGSSILGIQSMHKCLYSHKIHFCTLCQNFQWDCAIWHQLSFRKMPAENFSTTR